MLFLTYLIIFACLSEKALAGNSTTAYEVNPNFQQKTCRTTDRVFRWKGVQTSLTCGSICASDIDCESFFYFPTSLTCDGCKRAYSAEGQLDTAGIENVHYSIRDKQKYEYVGCYSNMCYSGQSKCEFSGREEIPEVTPEICFRMCDDIVGAIVSTIAIQPYYCFCEQHYDTRESGCDVVCPGNQEESCGGADVVSVYQLVE